MNIIKWSINLMLMLLFALVFVIQNASAEPAYCGGQISDVLVRSNGEICVKHSGSGSEWVCVDPSTDDAIKSRLLSVLVVGNLSGHYVQLSFPSGNCGAIPRWAHFDYVLLKR